MISAEVICDSISPQMKRLTTFKLRYPKFIHGEFMTHRVLSRNASSSRAVPTSKLIEEVRSDALRAAPVFWGKNQSGMQAVEELSKHHKPGIMSPWDLANHQWRCAALEAADCAERLSLVGAHKQIVNRLLEPFSHINVVATATEWDNFFGLRLHKDAQPEMRALAVAMWEAMKASKPQMINPRQWHLPFVDEDLYNQNNAGELVATAVQYAVKISVARCARVSYESFETGKRSTIEEDLKLYERLVGSHPMHASPAEHQATPDEIVPMPEGEDVYKRGWVHPHEHGNFVGWRQFRKTLPGEAIAPLPEEYLPF